MGLDVVLVRAEITIVSNAPAAPEGGILKVAPKIGAEPSVGPGCRVEGGMR